MPFAFLPLVRYTHRVNLPPVPNVWDQYPGELSGDYAVFLQYLQQGVARTIANVQRQAAGYTYSYLLSLRKAWLWDERAEDYDAMVLAQRREQFTRLEAEKHERWNHDQLEIAELAKQVILAELVALKQAQAEGHKIPVSALTQLMTQTHRWQQLSTGGVTDRVDNQIDFSKLSEADRKVLESEAVRSALEAISKQ